MKSKDQQLLEEAYKSIYLKESYLDKLKKLNPGWDPEKAKGDFADEYDPDDASDIEDHVDYEENAAEWLDSISSFTPGVKVGDWVKVSVQGGGGIKPGAYLGKITQETTTEGHSYGYQGYKGPTVMPAWGIKIFVPVSFDDYLDGVPGTYALDSANKKAYSSRGVVSYAQHDEVQSNSGVEKHKTFTKENTFSKLANQSYVIKDVD